MHCSRRQLGYTTQNNINVFLEKHHFSNVEIWPLFLLTVEPNTSMQNMKISISKLTENAI